MHVYVIVATEDRHHQECIVTQDEVVANGLYHKLQHIYGGENVSRWSRIVDTVPIMLIRKIMLIEKMLEPTNIGSPDN